MDKKSQNQILLLILIIIAIVSIAIISGGLFNSSNNSYNITKIGSNDDGSVYKVIAGDINSNETVGIILGVHPREHEIHEEVNKTIYDITSKNGEQSLTKKYVIYYVKTNSYLTSQDETRAAGEKLANMYIVPNIVKDNPFIVVDIHEINPNYEYSNFIFSLSDKNDKINSYISNITKDVDLVDFNFKQGTSPEKVTKPIAKQGINTFLIETDIAATLDEKHQTAEKLIRSLDSLNP